MSLSAVAPRHADHAAPGRTRRLILTILGPVLLLTVSLAVARLYDDDPGRVLSAGWPVDPRYEFTWRDVSAQPAFGMMVWFEAFLVVSFLYYWRLPRVQRVLVATGFAMGLTVPAAGVLSMLAPVVAAGSTSSAGRPPWYLAVEIAAGAGAFALGWRAAGPSPRPPEVTAAPPPHAPAMALGPRQRALFTASSWSVRNLLLATAVATVTALTAVLWADYEWQRVVLLAGTAVFVAAQARTRLQIDASGVTLRVPWVPFLSRTVPYALIRFAEARNEPPRRREGPAGGEPADGPPPGRYVLGDSAAGWGVVSGKGPVLVLSLADDRWFVYSTREARDAAALVNGELRRQRQAGTAEC
ncbi:hypothetical protein [Streptosporangium sp. NPDC023615]|uniref:hypothetical protein n=1 Tax=Streptosporangium sp. NPDC023615 TaxID=3154794 RepID=UPI00343BF9FD